MLAAIRQRISDFGRLTPLGLVALFLPIIGSSLLIVFISPVGNWLRENWQIGVPTLFSAVVFFCGLSLLPTNVIGVVSGWAFSFPLGLTVLILGIVGASYISFRLAKRLSGDRLETALRKYPRSRAIHNALLKEDTRKTTFIVLLLRLSVVMPFAFTNLLLAAGRTPTPSYLIGTSIGMLPRAAATAFVGSGLAELDLDKIEDSYSFIIGAAFSVISMIVLAIYSRRALERITK